MECHLKALVSPKENNTFVHLEIPYEQQRPKIQQQDHSRGAGTG